MFSVDILALAPRRLHFGAHHDVDRFARVHLSGILCALRLNVRVIGPPPPFNLT